MVVTCLCGDADCPHFDCGYPWCRSCGEHHRAPECPIDQEGRALASCGCPWTAIEDWPYIHLCGTYRVC